MCPLHLYRQGMSNYIVHVEIHKNVFFITMFVHVHVLLCTCQSHLVDRYRLVIGRHPYWALVCPLASEEVGVVREVGVVKERIE